MFWLNYQISKSEGQTNLNMPLQNIQKKIATAYWSNIIPFFKRKKQGKHIYVLMHQHFAKTNIGFHIEMIILEVYYVHSITIHKDIKKQSSPESLLQNTLCVGTLSEPTPVYHVQHQSCQNIFFF